MNEVDVREMVAKKTHAVFLANLENGSEEWKELRQSGVGGSDVGTICGFNRWSSAYTLWAQKTGKIERDIASSEPMEWGTRLESVILDKFEETHSDLILHREIGTWHHPERPWQLANPDAIFEDEDGNLGIVEVKTATYEDDWKNGVPVYYRTQVQWYLATFGLEFAYVIVLFHGNKYREFEVHASKFEQEAHLQLVERWRDHVLHDVEPDFDGADSTYETVRAMHPEISDETVELGNLGVLYYDTEQRFIAATQEMNEMKSRVLSAMGNAKYGTVEDIQCFSRQARGNGTPYLVAKRK